MRQNYVIALSDSYGHLFFIATNVNSIKDVEKLNSLMEKWDPKPTPEPPYSAYFSAEEIFNSLRELTGHEFHMYTPNYCRNYGSNRIILPTENTWPFHYD